jgi:hypothetical protein
MVSQCFRKPVIVFIASNAARTHSAVGKMFRKYRFALLQEVVPVLVGERPQVEKILYPMPYLS